VTFLVEIKTSGTSKLVIAHVFNERWEADRDEALCRQKWAQTLESVEVSESECVATHEWVDGVGSVSDRPLHLRQLHILAGTYRRSPDIGVNLDGG